MRYLALNEVLALHGQVMAQSGGAVGILNLPALESALAQPRMTFGGDDLYPTLVEKAAVDVQERVMLQVAAGEITREEFTDWLRAHVVAKA